MPNVDLATLAIKADSTDLIKLDKAMDMVTKRGSTTEKQTSSLERGFTKLGVAAAGAISVGAAVAGVTKSINVFRELETRMIAVQKTTDFTSTEMDTFGSAIDDISRRVPVATNSLVDIAGVAGQLGIKGVEDVSKFTETMGKLTLATDIVGEQGAASVARLLNVTGESISTVDRFGSVLVALGNNSAATENEILSLATEVGQATSTFSVTAADTAALGAAMKSLGVSAELGGSVVGRAMREIEASINAGGEALTDLSTVTGIATEDLKEQFGTNATVVFQRWVEGIGGMIEGGTSAAEALDRFNLRGEEVLKVLPTMAVNSELLGKSLSIANDELERGEALNKEVAKASESLDSQLTIAGNIIADYTASVGEGLAPVLKDTIAEFRNWDEAMGDMVKQDIASWIGSLISGGMELIKAISVIDEVIQIAFAGWGVAWEDFVFEWQKGTLTLKSSFGLAFDGIKQIAAEGLENVAGNMATLPLIGDKIAEKFAAASGDIKASATATAEYEKELAKLESAHEANVSALEYYKQKQAETIELTYESTEAEVERVEAIVEGDQEIIESREENLEHRLENNDIVSESEVALTERLTLEQEKRMALETQLTENLHELRSTEHAHQIFLLDKEVAKMREVAGEDKKLQKQIADYHKLKQKEILADAEDTAEEKTWLQENYKNIANKSAQNIVDAFIAGENVKQAVAKTATQVLSKYAVDAATKGLTQIFEALGSEIGAWIGLGAAQSSGEGESVGAKLASAAGYLAGATAAVLAGKAVGNNFADGGWLSRNPRGGMINEGSRTKDDVFLSRSGPVKNMGMGGEFVLRQKATDDNLPFLHDLNEGNFTIGDLVKNHADGGLIRNFADGGSSKLGRRIGGPPGGLSKEIRDKLRDEYGVDLADDLFGPPIEWEDRESPGISASGTVSDNKIWDTTKGINDQGFNTFITSLISSGFNWYKAIIDSVIYYAGTAIGMIGGKEFGKSLFADGGQLERNFVDGGALTSVVGSITDIAGWDFGDIWDFLRGLPIISRFVERIDKVVFPFVRDTATPGKDIGWETIQDSLSAAWDGLFEDVLGSLDDLLVELLDIFDLFGGGGLLGSYENGTDYVPETGPYLLHRGEKVTTAAENAGNKIDMLALLRDISTNTEETAETLRKFDFSGLPETRIV